jgi:hypothetical protein
MLSARIFFARMLYVPLPIWLHSASFSGLVVRKGDELRSLLYSISGDIVLAGISVWLREAGEGDGGYICTYLDRNEHVVQFLSTPLHWSVRLWCCLVGNVELEASLSLA